MDKERILFSLLRAVVCGEPLTDAVKAACTEEMLKSIGLLSEQHDVAHLVGKAADFLDLPESKLVAKCRQSAHQAVFRHVRMEQDFCQICDALEKAKIPFIPLKGSVLRRYYPEPWMRTSCDIDVLVKKEHLTAAMDTLKTELQYTYQETGDHDVSLLSPARVHLELHYDTVPEGSGVARSNAVLSRVWEVAQPLQPGAYQYVMSDAMFYFYHIAHMAKHLQNGGCGIRFFLDLWILQHRVSCDGIERKQLLAEGGLLTFEEIARRLSEVWFSGAKPDALTEALELYVLGGGVFGTMENKIAIKQKKRGGRLRYALSRIFLPYNQIKFHYPILQKHKWLTPAFQIVRWWKLVFKGGWRQSVRELQINATVSGEDAGSMAELLRQLKLE